MEQTLSTDPFERQFSETLELALQGGSATITHQGQPVAVIISYKDFLEFQSLRHQLPNGSLADLARGWEDADEFAQELDRVVQERYQDMD
jgi:prevent-host-death family protein